MNSSMPTQSWLQSDQWQHNILHGHYDTSAMSVNPDRNYIIESTPRNCINPLQYMDQNDYLYNASLLHGTDMSLPQSFSQNSYLDPAYQSFNNTAFASTPSSGNRLLNDHNRHTHYNYTHSPDTIPTSAFDTFQMQQQSLLSPQAVDHSSEFEPMLSYAPASQHPTLASSPNLPLPEIAAVSPLKQPIDLLMKVIQTQNPEVIDDPSSAPSSRSSDSRRSKAKARRNKCQDNSCMTKTLSRKPRLQVLERACQDEKSNVS